MFKKMAFVVLLSLAGMPMAISAVQHQPLTFQTIKESRGLGKWLGSIIPFALGCIASHISIRMNQNNPDRQQIVGAAKFMRFFSFVGGLYFFDDWWSTDFKSYLLCKEF